MTQTPVNKQYLIEEILEILRSQAESMPPSPTSSRYLRALQSLNSSVMVGSHEPRVRSAFSAPPVPPRLDTAPADPITTYDLRLTTALTDWLVNQWLMSVPFSTASLYLDIISSLYGASVKNGLLPKTSLFSNLKASLKTLGLNGWKSGIDDEIFQRALRLTKNAACLISDDAIAADLVILSLTHSLLPLEQLALLKSHAKTQSKNVESSETPTVDDGAEQAACAPCSLEQDIESSIKTFAPLREDLVLQQIQARHCRNARRKYLFPLNQSQRTEAGLKKHVAKIVNALFRRVRLPQSTDPNQTVEALWAYAALRTGVPASEVVAALGHAPLGLPVLRIVPHAKTQSKNVESSEAPAVDGGAEQAARALCFLEQDIEPSIKTFAPLREAPDRNIPESALREVASVFLDNPSRWYAMSLRPGVRFTQVCRRIQLLSNTSSSDVQRQMYNVPLFYPCEEITRAIGKKIVIKQRPFIHSVVFFKARLTDIGPLFAKIGDLAWCYRQSAVPGAPYAEISQQQFQLFQQTIARFTPDYEVAPSGELELKPNDRVEILGGLFAGHEATFDSVANGTEADTPTVYRLNIIGDNGIEWRISVDSRLATQKNNYLE